MNTEVNEKLLVTLCQMNNACLFQITAETNCTWRGRQNAVMDAARDSLNEARLADDGAEQVARSVVDCSTTPRCRRSSSASSVSDYVIAEPRSSSCDDDLSLIHI